MERQIFKLSRFFWVGLIIAAALVAYGQQTQNLDNVEVQVLPVQGNVYILHGAGSNVAVQLSKQGVLLVDTSLAQMSDKILAVIAKLNEAYRIRNYQPEILRGTERIEPFALGKILYIINTSLDPDHTGGNLNLRKAGLTITGAVVAGNIRDATEGAALLSHDNVLQRMSDAGSGAAPVPSGAWPTLTYLGNKMDFYFNGEPIEIIHIPSAHTDGDSMVFFRRSDVVCAGDIFRFDSYPVIDLAKGGNVQGIIDGLNRLLDITVPAHQQEGGTFVIPGHGRVADEHDVLEYRDMVVIVRDRVRDMIKKGMTAQQIKTARPTKDWDPLYGSNTSWTSDMFVDAVYQSLTKKN